MRILHKLHRIIARLLIWLMAPELSEIVNPLVFNVQEIMKRMKTSEEGATIKKKKDVNVKDWINPEEK